MTGLEMENHWVEKEFSGLSLGDKRLNNRATKIAKSLSENPQATIPQVCKGWNETHAAYAFFNNPKISKDKILAPHIQSTLNRASHEKVALAIQDTTSLNFTNLVKTDGLGEIGDSRGKGLICHNTYLVSEEGLPLGILDQELWNRKKSKFKDDVKRPNTPIKKKESYKWQKALKKVSNITSNLKKTKIIHVADREADIFTFFEEAKCIDEDFIVRVAQNRRINKKSRASSDGEMLFASLDRENPLETVEIEVNDRSAPTRKRMAKIELRAKKFDFNAPRAKAMSTHNFRHEKLPLSVISAKEIDCEDIARPIHWILVTNVEIKSAEQILYCVKSYSIRWTVEVFHRILKTGCRVESIRFDNADKIKIYASFSSIIAWHIHWLTFFTRTEPNKHADKLFEPNDQKMLRSIFEKPKKGRKKRLIIKDCVIYIARLGGFLARKHDGFPGAEVIWRGLIRFQEWKFQLKYLKEQGF